MIEATRPRGEQSPTLRFVSRPPPRRSCHVQTSRLTPSISVGRTLATQASDCLLIRAISWIFGPIRVDKKSASQHECPRITNAFPISRTPVPMNNAPLAFVLTPPDRIPSTVRFIRNNLWASVLICVQKLCDAVEHRCPQISTDDVPGLGWGCEKRGSTRHRYAARGSNDSRRDRLRAQGSQSTADVPELQRSDFIPAQGNAGSALGIQTAHFPKP